MRLGDVSRARFEAFKELLRANIPVMEYSVHLEVIKTRDASPLTNHETKTAVFARTLKTPAQPY
jgi:hypothetical protein